MDRHLLLVCVALLGCQGEHDVHLRVEDVPAGDEVAEQEVVSDSRAPLDAIDAAEAGHEVTADEHAPDGDMVADIPVPIDDGEVDAEAETEPPCPGAPGTPVAFQPMIGALTGSVHAPASFGVLRPMFRWRPAPPGACADPLYEIEVDDSCATPGFASCSFASPEAGTHGIHGESWRPDEELDVQTTPPVGRRYYWRLRACCDGCCSAWSPVRYVDVGRVANDANGDGWSDLVAGSSGRGGGGPGHAELYLGGAIPDATVDAMLEAGSADEFLGIWAAGAGDLNADGFSDFIVGAPGADDRGMWTGRAYVFLGGAVPDGVADLVLVGLAEGESFGTSEAGVGDVDEDGFADVVVGAPGSGSRDGIPTGRAYLYRGGDPPAATPALAFVGEGWGDQLGFDATGVGDFDGDGHVEVAVCAPTNAGMTDRGGRVPVYRGGSAIDVLPDLVLSGSGAERFGTAVSGGGDPNGDGWSDLLVGVSGDAWGDPGRAELHLGGPVPDAIPDLVIPTDVTDAARVTRVAVVGDVDGDGLSDFAVGSPAAGIGDEMSGAAYLFLGGTPPDGVPDVMLRGMTRDEHLGWHIAGLGDLNGDGLADWAVAAPGPSGDSGSVLVLFGAEVSGAVPDLVIVGARGRRPGPVVGVPAAVSRGIGIAPDAIGGGTPNRGVS
ncbi:MAG: FG-GAP repeat protein [Acidobacteria bacterium]|nr:FG-GAP repeat protein [Acidobacteriota bacterium]